MRTSCSAASTPTTSSAGGCDSTRRSRPSRVDRLAAESRDGADRAGRLDRRDRQREHGQRDQDGLARARPRSATLRSARLRRRRAAARRRGRPHARHPAGDRPAVPRDLLRARHAARRPPRRQGLDPGVPLDAGRRRRSSSASSSGSPNAAVAELRQEGFAGEPRLRCAINMRYLGQNYEHEVRDAGRRRRPTTLLVETLQALRAAPRGALRLRDRGRGDRAAQLPGDGDRRAAARVELAGANGAAERPRAEREVYFRGHGFVPSRRSTAARRSRPARRSTGPCVIEEEGSTTLVEPGHAGRAVARGLARRHHGGRTREAAGHNRSGHADRHRQLPHVAPAATWA